MRESRDESRPEKVAPEAAKSFGGDYTQYSESVDVVGLASHEWHIFMDGYQSGYASGVAHGRQLEHDEVATLQREAARIVHELSGVPITDHEANERRARRSREYWAERRGEGGAA